MKKIFHAHLKALLLYVLSVPVNFFLFLAVEHFLKITIPMWVLFIMFLAVPIVSALIRLSIWRKRNTILTDEELERFSVKIFFKSTPNSVYYKVNNSNHEVLSSATIYGQTGYRLLRIDYSTSSDFRPHYSKITSSFLGTHGHIFTYYFHNEELRYKETIFSFDK